MQTYDKVFAWEYFYLLLMPSFIIENNNFISIATIAYKLNNRKAHTQRLMSFQENRTSHNEHG